MPKKKATDTIEVSASFRASPSDLYRAWISGPEHAEMTGSPATSDPVVGGQFTAWDGYIEGTHTLLVPGSRIEQRWRSADFPEGAPDSKLVIRFEAQGRGTQVTLEHSEIPAGQGKSYEKGWVEFYFEPMKQFFPES